MAHELPYIAAIIEAIQLEMERDETVLYFGQNMATTENEPFVDAFGGIPALLLGPGDPTSQIHGEDESVHLGDWRNLVEAEVRLLAELSSVPR